jgi:hypothetical protein
MSEGLEIYNQFNTIQVINTELPLTLRASFAITNAQFQNNNNFYDNVSYFEKDLRSLNLKSPLVFVRTTSDTYQSHITFEVFKESIMFYKWWNLTIPSFIQVYVFDQWTPPERTGTGMQLFRPPEITYDSSWNFLKIIQSHVIPAYNPPLTYNSTGSAEYTINTGLTPGNFAVGFGHYRMARIIFDDYDGYIMRDGLWLQNSAIKIHHSVVFDRRVTPSGVGWQGWYMNAGTTTVYVADVTNLPNSYP